MRVFFSFFFFKLDEAVFVFQSFFFACALRSRHLVRKYTGQCCSGLSCVIYIYIYLFQVNGLNSNALLAFRYRADTCMRIPKYDTRVMQNLFD